MKPSIYVTRKIPDEALNILSKACEIRMWEHEDIPVPHEVLEKEVINADGIYSLLTDTIDETMLEKSIKLKVISNMAVGYNNIDIKAAAKRGVMVTNTPGVLTETTADLTFALMLATARRIVEASDFIKKGKWKTWSPMLLTGKDIYGATLGIIGMGRIGEGVAKRAKGFDMRILYYNRNRKNNSEEKLGVEYSDMNTLLKESDFVCVMTPYTPETKNLIGYNELAIMKKSAVLINTSRGGIVDEDALYNALKDGIIWAAGLDVFENEPVSPSNKLLELPNVVALPHIGSASEKTRTRMACLAAENLVAALEGKKPPNLVKVD